MMKDGINVLNAIVLREVLRFLSEYGRFTAALLRPLVWLIVFAAGFRSALGLSIMPPYQTYITYEIYVVPGLVAMMQLFNSMQSSFGLVFDRELGSLKILLTSPIPRHWLIFCKMLASTVVSILQVYAFLIVAAIYGITFPVLGYFLVLPVLLLNGLMLAAVGLFLASRIYRIENFSGVMNFLIFPSFFLSSALYPLWKIAESSVLLRNICAANPFTHGVEAVRFALHATVNFGALGYVVLTLCVFGILTLIGFDPSIGHGRVRRM